MLYVVEGVDRTGKTTLCNRILSVGTGDTRAAVYMHFNAPKQHPLDEYIRPLKRYVPMGDQNICIDRHYLGELIWPQFFNRATSFDVVMARYVELFLESRGACCVLAIGSDELLEDSSEDEPTAGRVAEVADTFERTALKSSLYWHPYCYECNDDPRQFEADASREERIARQVFGTNVAGRWVGSPVPEIILVGEQVGPTTRGWELPFVPYKSASGHFLMEELEDVMRTRSFAIVNAFKPGAREPEDLVAFYAACSFLNPQPTVIALGNLAAKELKRQGIEHQKVPHPQYWKRFERRQGQGSYRKLILEAAN